MGQIVFDIIIFLLVVVVGLMTYALTEDAMDKEKTLRLYQKRFQSLENRIGTEVNPRLDNIEDWNDRAVVWMKNQQMRTKANAADIAKLKSTSIYVNLDEEDIPDIVLEALSPMEDEHEEQTD